MGDLDSEDFQPRMIARDAGMVVVSVDYRLAPGNPFPAALNDCVAAISWAASNSERLGATSSTVIVIGTSAGGNLAIASALKLIDTGHRSILRGVAALAPATVHPDAVPEELLSRYQSFREEADCPIDTAHAMFGNGGFWGSCFVHSVRFPITDVALPDMYTNKVSSYTSVLLHDKLHELPPTYIAVAAKDVLRDDGLLFKHLLEEHG